MMKRYLLLFWLPVWLSSGSSLHAASRDPANSPAPADTAVIRRYIEKAENLVQSHPDSAVDSYRLALRQAVASRDTDALQDIYRRFFLLLFNQTRYQEAFDLADQEVAMGKRWRNEALQMKGYNNLAIGYQFLNDYRTATASYLKAATLAGRLRDRDNEARILDNMSSLLLKLKDFQSAYTYGLRTAMLSREKGDTLYIISGLITMGNAMGGMEKYDSALLYFDQAEAMSHQLGNMLKAALTRANKGVVYLKQGKPDPAIREFRSARSLAEAHHYPYMVTASLKGLADCEIAKGNYHAAEVYTAGGIAMARSQQLGTELAEMYDNMAMIKQHLGKPAEAYAYKELYNQVNDSVMNLQIQTSITRMNIQYKAAKKDQEILAQKLQLTRTRAAVHSRNTWLLLVLVVAVALVVILVISWRNHQHKKKLHDQKVLALEREQEVVRLKALMDGKDEERRRISAEMHDDIGSGLTSILFLSNSLKSTATAGQAGACEKITRNASTLVGKMNEIIWSMNPEYDTLADLVAYLRREAGELLAQRELAYNFDIPGTIPELALSSEQRRNIYLTVKEALHNVVKHAGATEVDITFRFEGVITIAIRDNGKGMDGQPGRSFGNGLRNMRRRMEAIGGSFRASSEGGVTIELSLPLAG
jgi:signal transduction histidine kinase